LIQSVPRRDDEEDADPSKNRPHLYVVENVPHGAFFSTASDGGLLPILGWEFTDQASPATRQIAPMTLERNIPPPNRDHFRNFDGMLKLVSGQETAALHLHDFAHASMARSPGDSRPIPFQGASFVPPSNQVDGAHGDNIVWAVLQHAAGNYRPRPVPAGYGPLEQVVEVSRDPFPDVKFNVSPGERTAHHDARFGMNSDKYVVLGRMPELNDRAIPHGTVSSQHAVLAFNERANGTFEAKTWYLRPIKDNANGTHVNGRPVAMGQWAALPAGTSLQLGGVPLFVTVGIDDSIGFQTVPASTPKASSGASRSGARSPAPLPSPPLSARHPSRPPSFEKNGDGVRTIDLNGLDHVTLVSGSVVDAMETFVPVKGKPKSAHFIAEGGGIFNPLGGAEFVSISRQGGGLRVENPQKKKSIKVFPPGAPREGIEIKPGEHRDLPGEMVVLQVNNRSYRFRSETP
jgi:hypothetical protein